MEANHHLQMPWKFVLITLYLYLTVQMYHPLAFIVMIATPISYVKAIGKVMYNANQIFSTISETSSLRIMIKEIKFCHALHCQSKKENLLDMWVVLCQILQDFWSVFYMTLPNSAKAHEMYEDIHHPIIEVDVTCENKNCRSNEKMAVAWCFSCAFSYNNNRPMRLCNQCNKIRHSIYIRTISS